jgi:hypothetical protein
MKRVLYWIGLLTILILVLMPDVLAPPFVSASQLLAQSTAGGTASEQQYNPLSLLSDCPLDRILDDGTKVYDCTSETGCVYFESPDGTWEGQCFATAVERPHEEIAKATEEPRNPQGGSQSSQQGNSQQSTQSCRLLRIDSDGTKVLDCEGTIVYVDPDSSMAAWADLRSEHKPQGQSTGQSRQDDDQQGGDQQGGDQQGGDQQSDVRQGYGCAARV